MRSPRTSCPSVAPAARGPRDPWAVRRTLSGRAVPVIVVTARDDPETESRCIELGAEDYITKPIQPATLIARIRAVLRRVGANVQWPVF